MRTSPSAPALIGEVLLVLAVVTALLVVGDFLGGSTLPGALVGWAALMLGIGLVRSLLRRGGQTWSTIGLGRPRSWVRTVLLAVVVAAILVFGGQLVLQALIVPLVGVPDSSRFAVLAGNPLLLAFGLFSVWTSAAFGEEIVVRGFAMGRIATALGAGAAGWVASLVLTSVLFGLMHFYQGAAGMVITGFIGFLLGAAYLAVGRNLWVVVLAHGLVDTLSFVQLFAGGR